MSILSLSASSIVIVRFFIFFSLFTITSCHISNIPDCSVAKTKSSTEEKDFVTINRSDTLSKRFNNSAQNGDRSATADSRETQQLRRCRTFASLPPSLLFISCLLAYNDDDDDDDSLEMNANVDA